MAKTGNACQLSLVIGPSSGSGDAPTDNWSARRARAGRPLGGGGRRGHCAGRPAAEIVPLLDPNILLPLLAKMLATALVVVSASVAAERAGSVLGALILALPISAGPGTAMRQEFRSRSHS